MTDLCSVPGNLPVIRIPENNNIGDIITTLNAEDGVTARITSQNPEGFFSISGLNLIAETVLDYEVNIVYLMPMHSKLIISKPVSLDVKYKVHTYYFNMSNPFYTLHTYVSIKLSASFL